MKLFIIMTAIASVACVGVQTATAQDLPIEFEGRVGAAFPVGDAPGDLSAGLSFGASIGYALTPLISAYGGYTQNNFATDHGSFSTGGFDLGARVNLTAAPVEPWLRGGLVFHRIEQSGRGGLLVPQDGATDHALGFEIGAGLGLRLGEMISVTPGVRYTTFTARQGDWTADVSSDALVADIGVRVGL